MGEHKGIGRNLSLIDLGRVMLPSLLSVLLEINKKFTVKPKEQGFKEKKH